MASENDSNVTTTPAPEPRIDPSTDPVKNILDKLYDKLLKNLLSNQVSWPRKITTALSLYAIVQSGLGLITNFKKPSLELNETTLRTNAQAFVTTVNYGDQCFYEDQSKKTQVAFVEKPKISALFDALSQVTAKAYVPAESQHTLGVLPAIIAAPCGVLNDGAKIDANAMGIKSRQAVEDFIAAAKSTNALKDASGAKGYYTFTIQPATTQP